MTDLIAELQRQIDRKSDVRLLDAVATGDNTVVVGGSTVAVTLPAIIPVVAGDFCQVLEQGASRVIIGPVGGDAGTYAPTLSGIAHGTGGFAENTASWSFDGRRIKIEGRIVFGTSGATFPTGAPTVTLPAGIEMTRTANAQVGTCRTNTGGTTNYGPVIRNAATTAVLQAFVVSGSNVTAAGFNTSVPSGASWTAGNEITWQIEALAVRT